MKCGTSWLMKTRFLSNLAAAGVLLSVAVAPAAAQDTSSSVLNFAMRNYGTQRFVGVRVVEFRRDGTGKRRTEYVTVDGRRVRTEFPSDSDEAGQIVVENPGERREYFPSQNAIRISGGRDSELNRLAEFLRRMGDRVRIKETGPKVVAGRAGHEVTLSDPDGNPRQRLTVDDANGLVLKRELFDSVGTVVASFEYTKIEFRDRIDQRLFRLVRKGAKVIRPFDELKTMIVGTPFVLAEFPADSQFKLEFSRILTPPEGKVLLQLYKGEEGRVSLFQTLVEVAPGQLRKFGREEVKTLSWRAQDRYFALVGNVPAATLERLKRLLVLTP